MCELVDSNSDLSRVISYWSGVDDDDERVVDAVSSVSWVLRDALVLFRRLLDVDGDSRV